MKLAANVMSWRCLFVIIDLDYRAMCAVTIACMESDNRCLLARCQNSLARVRASSQVASVLTVGRGVLMAEFRMLPLAGGA